MYTYIHIYIQLLQLLYYSYCCILPCIYDHCVRSAMIYLATRMATSISIEPFNASKVEWDSWSRRFDQWLQISPFATGEQGSNAFKLLCSLCAPKKPEECTYDALKMKLDAQYGVKRLVLVEHYHFYNYNQADGQSLTDYLAELRCLAATCDWEELQIADNLRNKFVMGLKNERAVNEEP